MHTGFGMVEEHDFCGILPVPITKCADVSHYIQHTQVNVPALQTHAQSNLLLWIRSRKDYVHWYCADRHWAQGLSQDEAFHCPERYSEIDERSVRSRTASYSPLFKQLVQAL